MASWLQADDARIVSSNGLNPSNDGATNIETNGCFNIFTGRDDWWGIISWKNSISLVKQLATNSFQPEQYGGATVHRWEYATNKGLLEV